MKIVSVKTALTVAALALTVAAEIVTKKQMKAEIMEAVLKEMANK